MHLNKYFTLVIVSADSTLLTLLNKPALVSHHFMKLSFRHWVLITGILSVILSFLFVGLDQDVYLLLLLIGLFLSGVSFIAVLVKDKGRKRLIWFGVVVMSILLQELIDGWLISKSFGILISKHQPLFDQANTIMLSKPDGLTFWSINHTDSRREFNEQELKTLDKLKKEAGLTYITKTSTRIFYETYGFLDARGGVSFFYKDSADSRLYKIDGQWYY